MTSHNPPSPDVNTFNPSYWLSPTLPQNSGASIDTEGLLQYPHAQGREFFAGLTNTGTTVLADTHIATTGTFQGNLTVDGVTNLKSLNIDGIPYVQPVPTPTPPTPPVLGNGSFTNSNITVTSGQITSVSSGTGGGVIPSTTPIIASTGTLTGSINGTTLTTPTTMGQFTYVAGNDTITCWNATAYIGSLSATPASSANSLIKPMSIRTQTTAVTTLYMSDVRNIEIGQLVVGKGIPNMCYVTQKNPSNNSINVNLPVTAILSTPLTFYITLANPPRVGFPISGDGIVLGSVITALGQPIGGVVVSWRINNLITTTQPTSIVTYPSCGGLQIGNYLQVMGLVGNPQTISTTDYVTWYISTKQPIIPTSQIQYSTIPYCAPLVNMGQNNYAPIVNPVFSNSLKVTGSATVDSLVVAGMPYVPYTPTPAQSSSEYYFWYDNDNPTKANPMIVTPPLSPPTTTGIVQVAGPNPFYTSYDSLHTFVLQTPRIYSLDIMGISSSARTYVATLKILRPSSTKLNYTALWSSQTGGMDSAYVTNVLTTTVPQTLAFHTTAVDFMNIPYSFAYVVVSLDVYGNLTFVFTPPPPETVVAYSFAIY